MPKLLSLSCTLSAALVLGFANTASADVTLGSTAIPTGATGGACIPSAVDAQVASDPSVPYTAPGAGTITRWEVNTSLATPGSAVTLAVLKPVGDSYTVVGADARNLPNPLTSEIASFTLSSPIAVTGGETLGLFTTGMVCYWSGGATPMGAKVREVGPTSGPTTGQALTNLSVDSPGGVTVNVAATFVPAPPAASTTTAPPKAKCKKHKRSAESAKKKKCKKKKKRG